MLPTLIRAAAPTSVSRSRRRSLAAAPIVVSVAAAILAGSDRARALMRMLMRTRGLALETWEPIELCAIRVADARVVQLTTSRERVRRTSLIAWGPNGELLLSVRHDE